MGFLKSLWEILFLRINHLINTLRVRLLVPGVGMRLPGALGTKRLGLASDWALSLRFVTCWHSFLYG